MPKGMLGELPLSAWQGPRDDFEQKLAGPDGPDWLRRFKMFLRRENPFPVCNYPVFMTIAVSPYWTPSKFRRALTDIGVDIGGFAGMMLRKSFPRKTVTLDLVVLSAAELGFEAGAMLKEIYERAWGLGLRLCPAIVGPLLRFAYTDQPSGEQLIVAMEPIDTPMGPEVFIIERDTESRLFSGTGTPEYRRSGTDRFVFVQRLK